MTLQKVQKELPIANVTEITCIIVDNIGDNYFSHIIDKAKDVSVKK